MEWYTDQKGKLIMTGKRKTAAQNAILGDLISGLDADAGDIP